MVQMPTGTDTSRRSFSHARSPLTSSESYEAFPLRAGLARHYLSDSIFVCFLSCVLGAPGVAARMDHTVV